MNLSGEQFARLFAGTSAPADPLNEAIQQVPKPVLDAWFILPLQLAAVLIPVVERDTGLTLLLTTRQAELRTHAGQIAFPGGRADANDADCVATALREAHEEIGLTEDILNMLGFLPVQPVITGYAVVPVIGLVSHAEALEFKPRPNPAEVAEVFEVPLSFLMERRNRRRQDRIRGGERLVTWEYQWRDKRIWGATAQMIHELIKVINNK